MVGVPAQRLVLLRTSSLRRIRYRSRDCIEPNPDRVEKIAQCNALYWNWHSDKSVEAVYTIMMSSLNLTLVTLSLTLRNEKLRQSTGTLQLVKVFAARAGKQMTLEQRCTQRF